MDFDYYQIKGKWNAATLNRRAEKLEEAQAAADELEEAGAKGVEIIGVKAGKRETIRGNKKAPATKKKAYTAPKMKVKAQEKPKPKKAAPKVEPAGQLDLFKTIKNFKIEFSKDEIDILRGALHLGGWSNVQNYLNSDEYVKLLNTLFDAGRLQRPKIELKNNEIYALCLSLEKRIKNEPNVFLKERNEKLRKQLESFVI